MVEKRNKKFKPLDEQDYDGDGIPDTVVTKDNEVILLMIFFQKI
jgi:hypothetical protein